MKHHSTITDSDVCVEIGRGGNHRTNAVGNSAVAVNLLIMEILF